MNEILKTVAQWHCLTIGRIMYFSQASCAKKMTDFIHCDVNVSDKAVIAALRLQHGSSVLNDKTLQLQHWFKLKKRSNSFKNLMVSCSLTEQRHQGCQDTVGVNISVCVSSCSDFAGLDVCFGRPGLGGLPQWGGEYTAHAHMHTMMLHWKSVILSQAQVCTVYIYRLAQRLTACSPSH